MNAIQNETRRLTANESRERVKRWSEILLTALDALATAALWCVFASTVVCFAFVPSEPLIASTLVLLTFATPTVYVLRETVWVWRESPCRLPKAEFRARVRSVSFPLWATAAVVAAAIGASGADSAFATACWAAFYVLCVEVGAARFTRRWGATVARDWRLALEVDTTSPNVGETDACVATSKMAPVCDIWEQDDAAPNADAFEEENADAADGETLATQRRVRAEGGRTQIFGSVAVEFEPEAEVAPVFIAFCPPFDGVPTFDFEQIAGPEIAVRPSDIQPFGVRLEAKRRVAQAAESQKVADDKKIRVEYFASFPPFDETDGAPF